jgi:hypothetical protein
MGKSVKKVNETELWEFSLKWVSAYLADGSPERMNLQLTDMNWDQLAQVSRLLFLKEKMPASLFILHKKVVEKARSTFNQMSPGSDERTWVEFERYLDRRLSPEVVKGKVNNWVMSEVHFEDYILHFLKWRLYDFFNAQKTIRTEPFDDNKDVEDASEEEDVPGARKGGSGGVALTEEERYKFADLLSLLFTVGKCEGGEVVIRNPHRLLIVFNGILFYTKEANISWERFYTDHFRDILFTLYELLRGKGKSKEMKRLEKNLEKFHPVLLRPTGEVYNGQYKGDVSIRTRAGTDRLVKDLKVNLFFLDYYARDPVEFDITGIVNCISQWRNDLKEAARALFVEPEARYEYILRDMSDH